MISPLGPYHKLRQRYKYFSGFLTPNNSTTLGFYLINALVCQHSPGIIVYFIVDHKINAARKEITIFPNSMEK